VPLDRNVKGTGARQCAIEHIKKRRPGRREMFLAYT